MRGPSETVHDGNLIVWACRVIAPLIIESSGSHQHLLNMTILGKLQRAVPGMLCIQLCI